uniref:Zinc ribbon domain-containing protein n=1 Tax=Candidatus Methanomethylicus mesodigestus TaxID=1867258 RepID=A0A7C3ER41_9CREN
MALQPFTRNFDDNSTEAGFQFTFHCDICNDGYKTQFVASKTYKKAGFLKGLGSAASIGASVLGRGYNIGYAGDRAANTLSQRFHGMSPEWHKEHEEAFKLAQNEAMGHFKRCPKCHRYVCESDWNDEEGLCVEDAPRLNVEIAAAKAQAQKDQIWEKAKDTKVFTGEIESKQTICPRCGKPSGQGKFCNNCGAPLSLGKCPNCGAQNAAGSRFCSECGTKLV